MSEPAPSPSPVARVVQRGAVREIRLARPEVHNALDEALIATLTAAFDSADDDAPAGGSAPNGSSDGAPAPGVRAVLLTAEGKSFCAGADLRYMRRVAAFSAEENLADARRVAALFAAVRACPVPVIARIQGNALGGGCGLLAACDVAIAAAEARFGFTEVRLGILPATISPFVIERIGPARARALFATGEIFDAAEALRIGLVDRVVPGPELDGAVAAVLDALRLAAPEAARGGKRLADRIGAALATERGPDGLPSPSLAEETAALIADLRARPEARAGMEAFLEKKPAPWAQPLLPENETPPADDGRSDRTGAERHDPA